jgi:hypothetical protein
MTGLKLSAGTDWARVAIIAHELGHHVLNHFLRVPDIETAPREMKVPLEIEADEFAGKVLKLLKAPLDTVEAAYRHPDICIPPNDRSDHPPCPDRLAAVRRGYGMGEPPRLQ